ncbi:hypothetical protein VKT23_009447 [Stygiomarasmius scandens]|uniref:Uncharacterized protein n=1 Tax=Marasmiellus scandens TaxID=2682957 RepID=A0ABR1JGH5_9AGAR
MDTPNCPYRRVITYSRKRLRRLGPSPASSDREPDTVEPTVSEVPESIVSDNSEVQVQEDNDVTLNAQDELRKGFIEMFSCPICYDLIMPPCM